MRVRSTNAFIMARYSGVNTRPPTYPSLAASHQWPQSAISRINFTPPSTNPSYISARYESLREPDDITLSEYLGPTTLDLTKLGITKELLGQYLMTLSNGQMRRARIAKALSRRPKVLLVEEPWMGLDPRGRAEVSSVLGAVQDVSIILGLRSTDTIPSWITHAAYVHNNTVHTTGPPSLVANEVSQTLGLSLQLASHPSTHPSTGLVEKVWQGIGALPAPPPPRTGTPIVDMSSVTITYGPTTILKNFTWRIYPGEKWGLFGSNGSGKTTLTSIITSDHPLTYALPVKHFGLSRLPQPGRPGIPLSALQSRIGVASPETHACIPGYLTLRRVIRSAFAETPLTTAVLTSEEEIRAEALMEEFGDCVEEGWMVRFEEMGLSTQRLVMFLRAVVGKRELVVTFPATNSGDRATARR